jgi:predicted outer membrane repeat protein
LTNCTFVGNLAGNHGGGIYNYLTDCTLTNCVFSGNTGGERGGGVYNTRSTATVANCSFSQNAAGRGGAVYCESSCEVLITNSIFWNDWAESGPEIALAVGSAPSTLTVSYSDVQGGFEGVSVDGSCSLTWGDGNLDIDPLYADADGSDDRPGTADDDLCLSDASPCIDAGNSQAVPPDAVDLDGDTDTGERTPLDRAGRARFVDHHLVDDTGLAFPPDYPAVVDLGAYEYPFCFGDLNDDGIVGLEDLATLIANYGYDSGMQYADGDLDGDGDVDLADLSALLPRYRTICE